VYLFHHVVDEQILLELFPQDQYLVFCFDAVVAVKAPNNETFRQHAGVGVHEDGVVFLLRFDFALEGAEVLLDFEDLEVGVLLFLLFYQVEHHHYRILFLIDGPHDLAVLNVLVVGDGGQGCRHLLVLHPHLPVLDGEVMQFQFSCQQQDLLLAEKPHTVEFGVAEGIALGQFVLFEVNVVESQLVFGLDEEGHFASVV
jgi:hypothetical protein